LPCYTRTGDGGRKNRKSGDQGIRRNGKKSRTEDGGEKPEGRGQKAESRMVKTLQALTVLALISAGVVFVLCAGQWLQGASGIELNLGKE